MSSAASAFIVVVTDVVEVNALVKRFHFSRADGGPMPAFSGGAHVVVEMEDGGVTRRNPYSLMSSPHKLTDYAISVRRHDEGRGGSLHLHRAVRPGTALRISQPVNLFALDLRARKHLMIAGGIGITPFLAQIEQIGALGGQFELHYQARTRDHAAYMACLKARHGAKVHTYCSSEGQRLDLDRLLATQPLGTHLYVCGPEGMIATVCEQARLVGWPAGHIHVEHFLAPPPGAPFWARLQRSNRTIEVGAHQSLLEAIEASGVDAPYLCRGGACGQCETDVLACDGELLHNDHWLTSDQRAGRGKIMPCVSRFRGGTLVLDR